MKAEKRRLVLSGEFAKQVCYRADKKKKMWEKSRCFASAESYNARMSFDLKQILRKVAEEDYTREKEEIERGLDRYKALILEIARVKRFDLAIWVEGSGTRFQKDERDLDFLGRAKLVKGELKYTHRNAYREYQLTKEGAEIATKLSNEKRGARKEPDKRPTSPVCTHKINGRLGSV